MAVDGLPVVFVHGSASSGAVWRHQVGALSARFRPVAIDLPGHGSGGEPAPSLDLYAEAVEQAIAERDFERPVLAGHSLGSAIVLTMALRRPGQYRGLILVGAGGRLRVMPEALALARADDPAAFDMLEEYKWGPNVPENLMAESRREAERIGTRALWCDLTACDGFDVLGRLGVVDLPVLVIAGADDRLTPLKYALYLEEHLPNCRLEIVPDAGHMVMLEAPDTVNAAIDGFLASLAA